MQHIDIGYKLFFSQIFMLNMGEPILGYLSSHLKGINSIACREQITVKCSARWYYAVPDQSIAAFCNLLIGLVSLFQTIWVSDRNSAGEPVRQFDFVQLLLNGLAQFELVDVVQDEHRLDDLAEILHRLIEAMLVRIGIQTAENARCRCLFELDRNDQAQKVGPN